MNQPLTYPLVECEGQHHLKLAPKRSQEIVHDENCCNGYGWLIKEYVVITTHDLKIQNHFDFKCKSDCWQCEQEKIQGKTIFSGGKGFTTKKLPKEGDWYNSYYESFSPKDAPRGAFEVKKVEIKENLTWQSIAPFKVEKIAVIEIG